MNIPDLKHLDVVGTQIDVIATPKSSRNRIVPTESGLRVYVTVVAEDGKANVAIQKLLSKATGTSKSKLKLLRGAHSRNKVFIVTD